MQRTSACIMAAFTATPWAATASVALAVLAMLAYPGGTAVDRSTIGYSFFRNFLSDLGMTVAFNGQPNRLARWLLLASFGIAAMTVVAVAIGVVRLYASSVRQRRVVWAATAAAACAGLSLAGAVLTPADRLPAPHLQFSLAAFGAGAVAAALLALATARDSRFPRGVPVSWLALASVIGALLSLGHVHLADDYASLALHATGQKVVAITLVAIVLYQSRQAARAIRLAQVQHGTLIVR